jgi:hypothetical protein
VGDQAQSERKLLFLIGAFDLWRAPVPPDCRCRGQDSINKAGQSDPRGRPVRKNSQIQAPLFLHLTHVEESRVRARVHSPPRLASVFRV